MTSEHLFNHLSKIFERDLNTVKAEIEAYPDDAGLWTQLPGCPNSGGTLAMHIAGNLRHFVGGQFGGSAYVRKRDEEFSARDIPRAELVKLITTAQAEVLDTLAALDPDVLGSPSRAPVGDGAIPNQLWLMHLVTHLSYHLGQLNYHRRLLTGGPASPAGSSLRALIS